MIDEKSKFWEETLKKRKDLYSRRDISFAPSLAIRYRKTKNPFIIARIKSILGCTPMEFASKIDKLRDRKMLWKEYGKSWFLKKEKINVFNPAFRK